MAQTATKLTVTVPREVASAVAEEARQPAIPVSEVVRAALALYLKRLQEAWIEEQLRQGYLAMTAEERRFHVDLAEEGLVAGNEALSSTLGGTEEEPWW